MRRGKITFLCRSSVGSPDERYTPWDIRDAFFGEQEEVILRVLMVLLTKADNNSM